jgi:hypothetical protein
MSAVALRIGILMLVEQGGQGRYWKATAPHCELSVPLAVETGRGKNWD